MLRIDFHNLKSNQDFTFNGGYPLLTSQKILMKLFEMNFLKEEKMMDEAMIYSIIRIQVINGLIPYQMFEFHTKFGLRDPSI